MMMKNKEIFPAFLPQEGVSVGPLTYTHPPVIGKMLRLHRLDRYLKGTIRATRMDEFTDPRAFDEYWSTLYNQAVTEVNATQRPEHEFYIQGVLRRGALEKSLLEGYLQQIEKESSCLQNELDKLEQSTYEWTFK